VSTHPDLPPASYPPARVDGRIANKGHLIFFRRQNRWRALVARTTSREVAKHLKEAKHSNGEIAFSKQISLKKLDDLK
jgi:hypothetical protein